MEPTDHHYSWNTANNNVTKFPPFTTNNTQTYTDTLKEASVVCLEKLCKVCC